MKFEHCRILLADALPLKDKKQKGLMNRNKVAGWGYDCQIHYFLANGEVKVDVVASIEDVRNSDPFCEALARLSSEGWELVSAQHSEETVAYDDKSPSFNTLSTRRQVAYFKRPVHA